MKGAVSAQKALHGSETETRELLGGTEEISVSPERGHQFAHQATQMFFTKRKRNIIEFVARPAEAEPPQPGRLPWQLPPVAAGKSGCMC